MKITLIHNPNAGKGKSPSGKEVVTWIRTAGHKVVYQSSKKKKWHKALKDPGDLVAVAGGDGTVGKVARRLINRPTPIAILPMGTANNIASTLGVSGALKDLVARWSAARCVHFDAAVARGPWGAKHLIEGFGMGLFAETMFRIDNANAKEPTRAQSPESEIDSVLKILPERLRQFKANPLTVRLDGRDLSGDYVLLEAMNIGFIGPNLNLAPQADTKDGFLDIIAVPHRQRAKLQKYLMEKATGTEPLAELPSHKGRDLQIEWQRSPVHIDDAAWPDDPHVPRITSYAVTVRIDPGALIFLVP